MGCIIFLMLVVAIMVLPLASTIIVRLPDAYFHHEHVFLSTPRKQKK